MSFPGRGALPDWLEYSYVTPNFSRAVSRGVEYAANDFGLHQVALGLNLTSDAAYYLNRSRNWRNYWNPSTTSLNYTGFVQPRAANGTFISYSPVSSLYPIQSVMAFWLLRETVGLFITKFFVIF